MALIGTRRGRGIPGRCFGVNGCAGKGACKSTKNDCKGKNACKGQGWVEMLQDECKNARRPVREQLSELGLATAGRGIRGRPFRHSRGA